MKILNANNVLALIAAAGLYGANGPTMAGDVDKPMDLLHSAAEQGDADAQYRHC